MTSQAEAGSRARRAVPSRERAGPRWLTVLSAAAAGFTALCCLGVSAAVSLSTALGATFLTRDATLRPLLAATLALTVAASALSFWRRRRPWPLALTVLSALWIYSVVYLVGGGHHGQIADHMGDHMATDAAHHASTSGRRLAAVWFGLALLIGAQLSDLGRLLKRGRRQPIAGGDGRR